MPLQSTLRHPLSNNKKLHDDVLYLIFRLAMELEKEDWRRASILEHKDLPGYLATLLSVQLTGQKHEATDGTGSRPAIAKTLSLVCKDWYAAAHRLVYHTITLAYHDEILTENDSKEVWDELISRLRLPPHASKVGQWSSQTAGEFVRRLDITALKLSPTVQKGILALARLCPNLYSFALEGLTYGPNARLTSEDPLTDELADALSTSGDSLIFLSIALLLESGAVPGLINCIGKLPKLRFLVLCLDVFVQPAPIRSRPVPAIEPAVLPDLETVVVDSIFGGNYSFFDDLACISTSSLKTVMVSGLCPVPGFGSFIRSNESSIISVMIDYKGMLGFPALPSLSELRSIIIPYNWVESILPPGQKYPSARYIGISGVVCCHVMLPERQIDMVLLTLAMNSLFDRERFSNLLVIQFLEITNLDMQWTVWSQEDALLWDSWTGISQENGIILLDGEGEILEAGLLAVCPDLDRDSDTLSDGYMADLDDNELLQLEAKDALDEIGIVDTEDEDTGLLSEIVGFDLDTEGLNFD